jgi:hypothetical protein
MWLYAKLGNAVKIRDQRYRTGTDTGMAMPYRQQLTTDQSTGAGRTFSRHSGIYFDFSTSQSNFNITGSRTWTVL